MTGDHTPPSTLPWRMGLSVVLAGLIIGCNSKTPPVADIPPPPVTVSQPVVRNITDPDDYEGRIGAVQKVEIRARVRGHLAKILFQDGQLVAKDAPLFEIDRRTYKATYDRAVEGVKVAQAKYKLAKADYKRALKVAETPGAI